MKRVGEVAFDKEAAPEGKIALEEHFPEKHDIRKNNSKENSKSPEHAQKMLEIVIAVLLAITAFLTAWATWIGSLHAGLQAIHFTESNNLASSGNAMYNISSQILLQDMLTWNNIQNQALEVGAAQIKGNPDELQLEMEKLEMLLDKCDPEFKEAINWALDEDKSPFDKEGYIDAYFADANETIARAEEAMETGKQDNTNSDTFGLVTVIYSIILFLLGIAGVFKRLPNRIFLVAIAGVLLVCGFVFMISIPMPAGFDFGQYVATLRPPWYSG